MLKPDESFAPVAPALFDRFHEERTPAQVREQRMDKLRRVVYAIARPIRPLLLWRKRK